MEFWNNRSFVVLVRSLGWAYFAIMLVNTVFFYGKYLYQTPLAAGPLGILAFFMMTYQVKQKPLSLLQRFLLIAGCVFLLLLTSYVIWRQS